MKYPSDYNASKCAIIIISVIVIESRTGQNKHSRFYNNHVKDSIRQRLCISLTTHCSKASQLPVVSSVPPGG